MLSKFKEIEDIVLNEDKKQTIVLAGAHDSYSLKAIINVRKKGIANAILVGDSKSIYDILNEEQEDFSNYEIVDCKDEKEMTKIAVALINEGKADLPMKGLLQTSDFMRPILNKEQGLVKAGNVISQATLVEYEKENRFFAITDCAINISPDVERKKQIINNTVDMMKKLGYTTPKVAVISALEKVNPKIKSTVDAEELKNYYANENQTNCLVSGPFGLDNAISKEAADHKNIDDPIAGVADILLVPDLCVGNVLTKSLIFFTQLKTSGILLGAKVPLIAVSRSDTPENKYRAIILALYINSI